MDANGNFFGDEGLLAALGKGDSRRPEQICREIWEAHQPFQGTVPRDDDITLLAVRAN